MKVLLINDNYSHIGGAETYFHNLYNLLKENKNNPYLFSMGKEEIKSDYIFVARETSPRKKLFESKSFKDILIWGLKKSLNNVEYFELLRNKIVPYRFQEIVTKCQFILLFGNHYLDAGIETKIRSWASEINPSIIHINNNYKYPISVYSGLKEMNIPIVKTVHDFGIICPTSWCLKPSGKICKGGMSHECVEAGCITSRHYELMKPVNEIIRDLEKKCVTLFITPSKILKQKMEAHGFNNVMHIPNFINVIDYKVDFSKIETGNVLYVGGLTKHKGVIYLLSAFPLILEEFPRARLNIVGVGPLGSYLKKKTKQLGITDKVIFHGKIPDDNVKELYQKSNVVVVPSLWMENSPMVIYEAMGSGRPVVGSKIGGIPELIRDGKTGFLVEPGNHEDIAEKIIRILADRDLARRFGENSRETAVREYSPETHYKKIMEVYNGVASL